MSIIPYEDYPQNPYNGEAPAYTGSLGAYTPGSAQLSPPPPNEGVAPPALAPPIPPQPSPTNPQNPFEDVLANIPNPYAVQEKLKTDPTQDRVPGPGGPQTIPPPDGGETTPPPDGGTTTPPPDGGNTTPPPDTTNNTPPPGETNAQRAARWAKAEGWEWLAGLPDGGESIVDGYNKWVAEDPTHRSKVTADVYMKAYHGDKRPGQTMWDTAASRALIYSQHPGYEWVSPYDVAQYIEDMQRMGAEGNEIDFPDWVAHRFTDGRSNPAAGRRGFDTYLYRSDGSLRGFPKGYTPDPTGMGTPPGAVGGPPATPNGGNPPVATTGGPSTTPPGAGTPAQPNVPGAPTQADLDAIRQAIKNKGMLDIMEGERQLRGKLGALNPYGDVSGGVGAVGEKYMSDSVTNLSSALAGMDYETFNKNQDRALQERLGNLDADTRRYLGQLSLEGTKYGADRGVDAAEASARGQMAAASAAAAAQRYSADINYRLGIVGADVDRERNWYQYQAAIFGTMPDWLRAMYQFSPNAQLGGLPIYGPDYFLTNKY